MKRTLITAATTVAATFALWIGVAAPASAQAAAGGKKELVAKILKYQEPAIEQLARQLVEQPALVMLNRAGQYIQARVEPDKREALMKDLQAEARKYADQTVPLVRERALKLAPTTLGTVMEEKLTEAELREVLRTFESPAWRKFQSLAPELQKSLGEKLVADVKDQVEPRVRALDQTLSQKLGLPAPGSAASAAPGGK